MKKIKSLITGFIAMVFLAACGGGGTPSSENQEPTVRIEVSGFMQEGENITFKAIASDSDGQIVDYQWSGDITGNTEEITQTFAEGGHTVTVTVTDDDGATASSSNIFTVSAVPRTYIENLFNLDDLKNGDSFYWNGSAWTKNNQACQYSTIDRGNGEELDATSIQLSSLKLHFSLGETDVDGKIIVGCSLDTYQTGDQYDDMMIVEYNDSSATIIAMSDHSDPNNPAWVGTNEDINVSKFKK